jgi:hypothetical protein
VLVARVLAWAWSPGLVLIDDGDVVGELPRRVVLREEEEVASLLPLFFLFASKRYLGRVGSGGGLGLVGGLLLGSVAR